MCAIFIMGAQNRRPYKMNKKEITNDTPLQTDPDEVDAGRTESIHIIKHGRYAELAEFCKKLVAAEESGSDKHIWR